ncbi:transaldolase [Helicobacter heilmannii]|uniref:Transaldolase n=1 Tax=Helicobacter heilmannii TaxID=35817 RepID=A0A0K2XYR2_HELHE|nr:transaldolase [Helicobacter heilmannii]CCM11621.1 Transaldolase [Helicobacter heilmannii ASB1.4]CRF45135.1 Transaldolase [Helicobacter heilmannii]CRF51222.1 Transaldolase [Helicobacter heilmannii]CRI35117.1 Transaldolase [Helicobacter heilmannii]BDQ26765.1 transaldolase [Helicobacter heilmannii]
MKDFYLWCDFIERDFLEEGFQTLLKKGQIAGATSNPAIFAKALESKAYQAQIAELKNTKMGAKDIYEHLVIADIKRCAQILLPLWEKNKATGYISLEIDPFLADNVGASVAEARALFGRIGMPNAMIKVPATQAGLETMEHLAKDKNIPLNATLVFDPKRAGDCALALKKAPMGVVSIFVSRLDTLANRLLQDKNNRLSQSTQATLLNQFGIANALECYHSVQGVGASRVYPLFASVGTKDPSLPKDYYLQALKLEHSITTAPLEALKAYHETPSAPTTSIKHIKETMQDLGLDLEKTRPNSGYNPGRHSLLLPGLKAFEDAFSKLLKALT